MIKTIELNPGNIIMAQEPVNQTIVPWEVREASETKIKVKNGGNEAEINSVDALPVPITQNLLQKIGFGFMKLNDAVLKDDGFTLHKIVGKPGWSFDKSGSQECNYLHQLQNTYEEKSGTPLKLPALKPLDLVKVVNADIFNLPCKKE